MLLPGGRPAARTVPIDIGTAFFSKMKVVDSEREEYSMARPDGFSLVVEAALFQVEGGSMNPHPIQEYKKEEVEKALEDFSKLKPEPKLLRLTLDNGTQILIRNHQSRKADGGPDEQGGGNILVKLV